MEIIVKNKRDMEAYAKKSHTKTSIVISISSFGSSQARIIPNKENGILRVCYSVFNDTDSISTDEYGISSLVAFRIVNFLKEASNQIKFDQIIVQCEAGQSRSAGVAAALMKYINGDDTPIFDNPRYKPNMRVYRSILDTLYASESWVY